MTQCTCTMAQSLTGDGCRYCQPQEYIDRLHDRIDEYEKDCEILQTNLDAALIQVRQLRRALAEISLCSVNSMSSKDECGRIARKALEGK